MRVFTIGPAGVGESDAPPAQLPAQGHVWIACSRPEFERGWPQLQATLQTLCGMQLVDLHVSDLINAQQPSHFDYTSQYDLLEHIERVVHHVRRLEQSVETAVQIHFNAQSHRTNDIMRTLTVLTAIFLPLNLIAGIFGMNFEFIPLIHNAEGFWWAMAGMGLTAVALALLFWRKRYLERSSR